MPDDIVARPLEYIANKPCAHSAAIDRDHQRGDSRIDDFSDTALRAGEIAGERAETFAKAGPVGEQASEHVDKVSGARQAAAETDCAQAPATAKPEPRFLAVLFECSLAKQRLGGVDRQQALEHGGCFLVALIAVQFASGHGIGKTGSKIDAR